MDYNALKNKRKNNKKLKLLVISAFTMLVVFSISGFFDYVFVTLVIACLFIFYVAFVIFYFQKGLVLEYGEDQVTMPINFNIYDLDSTIDNYFKALKYEKVDTDYYVAQRERVATRGNYYTESCHVMISSFGNSPHLTCWVTSDWYSGKKIKFIGTPFLFLGSLSDFQRDLDRFYTLITMGQLQNNH